MTERAPLAGLTVAVTRARAQADELAARLVDLGARVVEAPVIEIHDPADGGAALRRAAAAAAEGRFAWVVVTSTNGAERLVAAFGDRPARPDTRVAAIGPATAAVLERAGVVVDLVPQRFVAEALVEGFPRPSGSGRVLIARAAVARDVLPEGLAALGWDVDVVEAYRTEPADASHDELAAAAAADVITFTSPSTVAGAVARLGADRVPAVVACIGPITAAAAREHGVEVTIEATVHTIPGLVDAIEEWARSRRQ